MNRIFQWSGVGNNSDSSTYRIEQARIGTAERGGMRHSMFVPLHYEQNYEYPLLVWLHGPGDNETQLTRVMPLISMRNYAAIAPRGTNAEDGPSTQGKRFHWEQSEDEILTAEQRVLDCIDIASEKLNINRARIYLAGFECGGTMAIRLALRDPNRYAGAVSIGGPFPTGHQPLLNIADIRHLQLMIALGRDSENYPTEMICEHLRLFHAAALKVTLRQYPCGDELTTKMLSDVDAWIMELVTGATSCSSRLSYHFSNDYN